MKIDREKIEHVALLSRLDLSEEEIEAMAAHMQAMLDYVEELRELDVEDVDPAFGVGDLKNVFRTDEVKPSVGIEKALENAPERAGDGFKVPRVLGF